MLKQENSDRYMEKMEAKVTQGSGNGLFAMEDLKKGDFVIKYVGKII